MIRAQYGSEGAQILFPVVTDSSGDLEFVTLFLWACRWLCKEEIIVITYLQGVRKGLIDSCL